jgi:hypothetical protein
VGRPSGESVQGAREVQWTWRDGFSPGLASKAPAGTMTERPLRVRWGIGEPQRRQKPVAKLAACGRSKRVTSASPRIHRKASG